MAVDNPSYFSLSSGTATSSVSTTPASTTSVAFSPPSKGPTGLTALFRRRPCKMGTTSSASVLSTSTTSTLIPQDNNKGSTSGASTPTEEKMPMLPRNGTGQCGNGTHGGPGNQRRSFRNLFRSVSANADHERTQQFLKGDPRPSDVAPPSPYLPHRSHSHSENDRRRPGRSRAVLKSASELLSNDMVYCGLARDNHNHDDDDDDDDDDDQDSNEVFVGVDDARYYNLSSTLPATGSAAAGRRRHSISTFIGKDRGSSSKDHISRKQPQSPTVLVQPDTMAPPAPVDTVDGAHVEDRKARSCSRSRRRRHRSSSSRGSRSATGLSKIDSHPEDDVLFVSSKDSEISSLWVNYLTACFEQISRQQGRPPFKVRHVTIEESMQPGTEERIRSARLQIVVVCPILLERVQTRPEHATNLSRQLITDKVLAMMLGVHDSHISDVHKSILVSYNQWRKFFVKDQDETFVGELLGAAVGILGTMPPPALRSDKTAFSVHPKKVKLGHNRIIALLNDPLRPEDNVSVIVDRCGEAIDIAHVKRRNPYALQFSIPDRCLEVSMLVGVRIAKNGCPLGVRQVKCESRLRELDQILRAHDNPLEFMCQTFGFNPGDREKLDNWMVHAFQRNVPPHFNLLSTPSGVVSTQKVHSSPEENPTLLHFAARFGLERLAWQLLECPGGDIACDLRNVSELTPADLAEQAGHTRLAHQLRGYMQMNEFTNMYSYLKVISETTTDQAASADPSTTNTSSDTNNDKEDYCRPRPLSEAYSVPPAARPITSLILPGQLSVTPSPTTSNPIEANYSIVPAPTPVIASPSTPTPVMTSSNGFELPLQGYMKMHPAGPKTPTSNAVSQQPSRTATPTQSRSDSHPMPAREENSQSSFSYGRTTSNSSSTKSREPSGPQDELLEIINDFKNNVFTITEVERLVENWRNRNDVQQSFKDKQRQLTAMREEYERIQKRMKEEMKAPTPFDRIRKFFSKGKKDTKDSTTGSDDSSSTSKVENVNGALTDRRPVSSLSLRSVSSSSSSGRMSTASGCSGTSLGDSGTHSDTEDRRLQNAREDKAGVMSYEIPPAPKPFAGRYSPALRYSPSPRSSTGNDLDLRPSQPQLRGEDTEYYIAFPPSGLPIHSFKTEASLKEPKTPSSPCDHPKYLDLIQNSSPVTNDASESESTRHSGNSYANIDPSTLNPAPVPPAGMCIPTNYVNVTPACVTSSQETTQGQQSEQRHSLDLNHISETSKNSTKAETPSQAGENKVTDDVQGQDNVLTEVQGKNNEEYVETNLANSSEGVDVPDTGKLPEYMNVDVPQDQKAGATKKVPAPPVPPRVATKK
ncbi:phosphoinositide 3-kinase adapter protein 1 isoform X2 [Bombus terrestris]|uniref:Phosphoinositide 3-kinase adapter protein 1 isoform X2 n=1 Tax=Bombus terrestris TaxID=30195 RepID=A0A9C6SRC4_BOMTE|nr:phosphoinositide 3-kinase adapter protein 1 isoform X2 [Bombus terrestris]